MLKENKAEHHRSHRLAAVETVNISFLQRNKIGFCKKGRTRSGDAYFL